MNTAPSPCKRPPEGWACKRPEGHNGPCASYPLEHRASWLRRLWCMLTGGHCYRTRIDTARYALHMRCQRCADHKIDLL